jgi:tetratricopeptide (TPR) repeat protein
MRRIGTRSNRITRLTAIISAFAILVLVSACEHKSVDSYLNAGDQAMQNTKLADAESDYQSAAKAAPNDPRPHIALGNLYLFEQKPGPAQLEYMKVLEIEPRNAPAHAALGNIYASMAQPANAEAQYRAAIAVDPVHAAYRMELGNLLQKQGKPAEAEAQFLTAIGLEPKNARAHLALANLLASQPNRSTEAQAEYAEARALDPSLAAATTSPAAPVTEPGASPAAAASAVAGAPAPKLPLKVRDLNRKFKLTHDSPVYETPADSARVLAQVHRGKWVNVTGITGNWLRIKLRNGTVGFIPVTAAE